MTAAERGCLLLCGALGDGKKPLTLRQFRELRARVSTAVPPSDPDRELTAADLRALGYDDAMASHIEALLGREAALNACLEAARFHGIAPLTAADPAYPKHCRKRLREQAPPVLFYRGELSLLQKASVSLVGSRRLQAKGRAFAEKIGRLAAREGFVLGSGNAVGADQAAQQACLEAGGSVISVLADSLAEHTPPPNTLYLCEDGWHLPFSAQRALKRNRLIFALGDRRFVAQTGYGVGGTWTGASEALQLGMQIFVHEDGSRGAEVLIENGAMPISPENIREISTLPLSNPCML